MNHLMNSKKALSNTTRQLRQVINELASGEHRVRNNAHLVVDLYKVKGLLEEEVTHLEEEELRETRAANAAKARASKANKED